MASMSSFVDFFSKSKKVGNKNVGTLSYCSLFRLFQFIYLIAHFNELTPERDQLLSGIVLTNK